MTPIEIGRAIRAYLSENCPACDGQKHRRQDPFCSGCMNRVPDPLLEQLGKKDHFIQAFGPAIDHLKG